MPACEFGVITATSRWTCIAVPTKIKIGSEAKYFCRDHAPTRCDYIRSTGKRCHRIGTPVDMVDEHGAYMREVNHYCVKHLQRLAVVEEEVEEDKCQYLRPGGKLCLAPATCVNQDKYGGGSTPVCKAHHVG